MIIWIKDEVSSTKSPRMMNDDTGEFHQECRESCVPQKLSYVLASSEALARVAGAAAAASSCRDLDDLPRLKKVGANRPFGVRPDCGASTMTGGRGFSFVLVALSFQSDVSRRRTRPSKAANT
eukprot:CAMPEP_0175888160 /NCGR_PEP_ID=MMETSP0107_2-20121207/46567_1 /TAXON_ID=195067 ORGANISM="Goniomonas pacifica, Strain CCMP1869" /NCGR_SAMPLE_ID=MMETSP0107_2 /ASSEMBLY_ACC=CAM_ASM_000203 /LENGTH=122 /DNA_ID=CAMNT_0017208681 /DNA_START=313 /DNA_END=681 /DNA_ORIENTATION=-